MFFRGAKSRFFQQSKGPRRFQQTEAATTSQVPELTYKHVRKALLKNTKTTKAYTVLTLGVTAYAIYNVWNEWNETPEQLLDEALLKLNSRELSDKESGFDLMKKLNTTSRVFSGRLRVPLNEQILSSPHTISSLLYNIDSSNPSSINDRALEWLYKVSTHSSTNKEASLNIIQQEGGVEKLVSLLSQSDYSKSKNWFIASQILVNLSKHNDKIVLSTDVDNKLLQSIELLDESRDPLAISTAVQLLHSPLVKPEDKAAYLEKSPTLKALSERIERKDTGIVDSSKHIIDQASKYLTRFQSTSQLVPVDNVDATLGSILVASVLGGIWGKYLWSASSRVTLRRSLEQIVPGYDAEVAEKYRRQFVKGRYIGRSLFALFLFDYVASHVLQHLYGAPNTIGQLDQLLPTSTSSSSGSTSRRNDTLIDECKNFDKYWVLAQIAAFSLGSLYLIQKKRFVFVPIVLTGIYNNRDLVERHTGHSIDEIMEIGSAHLSYSVDKLKDLLTNK
eukprot:TRINITY_DN6589_c0_g1_i1.p1 TRINITY_DN6589_c0_g1~~TRINITY_DN6589_c0_g1_i1.p1  ORF type:complete len:505 (+),score=111.27 TRINITY_DN6589_c0_g1_i1:40-1554(+)